MHEYEDLIARLLARVPDSQAFSREFSSFLRLLNSVEPWAPSNPTGRRLPWQLADEARKHLPHLFAARGAYMFGAEDYPIYVGMTRRTLWKRLRHRYLREPYGQLVLARNHAPGLLAHGVDGLPPTVRDWYARNFRKATVRLRHSLEMAKMGVSSIWIALLPVTELEEIRPLEKALIGAASAHNRRIGRRPLLNELDVPLPDA